MNWPVRGRRHRARPGSSADNCTWRLARALGVPVTELLEQFRDGREITHGNQQKGIKAKDVAGPRSRWSASRSSRRSASEGRRQGGARDAERSAVRQDRLTGDPGSHSGAGATAPSQARFPLRSAAGTPRAGPQRQPLRMGVKHAMTPRRRCDRPGLLLWLNTTAKLCARLLTLERGVYMTQSSSSRRSN
jgi:hypothetical protein